MGRGGGPEGNIKREREREKEKRER